MDTATEKGTANGIQKPVTLQSLLTQENVKKRFEEMLGKKAAGFISSVISATKSNKALQNCEPNSVLSAAVIAATLDLPIQNNLGFAAIVPYKEKGVDVAQFQMMAKGYIQLAMRSSQYQTMNVCEVYEGELIKQDRFTGEFEFDETKRKGDKIIGYTAHFRMNNGFEKRVYWTVAQIEAHGKKYSKSYDSDYGQWKKNFDAMAKKTVLKMLLSKYGILSVDMQLQQAVISDQSNNVTEDGEFEYVDNPKELVQETDKGAERIALMIEDAKTIEDLAKIENHVQPEQMELFNTKRDEILKSGKKK